MKYYFYLARCSNGALYSGFCKNRKEREATHNAGKGAKYTRAHRPVKIIYSEIFDTQTEAMRREAQVKKWSKIKKENLAAGKHPTKLDE